MLNLNILTHFATDGLFNDGLTHEARYETLNILDLCPPKTIQVKLFLPIEIKNQHFSKNELGSVHWMVNIVLGLDF